MSSGPAPSVDAPLGHGAIAPRGRAPFVHVPAGSDRALAPDDDLGVRARRQVEAVVLVALDARRTR